MNPERHHYPHPSLLFHQPTSLPLPSLFTEGCCRVAEVQRRLGYEHVTGRAAGVGEVPLFQNYYHFVHVAVQKVDLEFGVHRCTPLKAPHWTPDGPGRSREGDPV